MSLTIVNPMAPPTQSGTAQGNAGWLTDTDLARESAQLAALRNRQRLTGAAATAAPTPRTLLSLFRND